MNIPRIGAAGKATGELLLAGSSRKGFRDGIGIRPPTISIRPKRAKTLGCRGERSFEEIIRDHIEDALKNQVPEYA